MATRKKLRLAKNTPGRALEKFLSPIHHFLSLEPATGIVLLISTVIALAWANSQWADSYFHLIHIPITFSLGGFALSKSLLHFVNDGLMVLFFYTVGLEIKRELLVGELSSPKKASFAVFGALGGMVLPALVYFALNPSGTEARGWGIPMATDIAFAVGVLALIGKRVPVSLKIFLLALAIVDDIGAVLVIAFFYTDQIFPAFLGMAAAGLFILSMLATAGVRNIMVGITLGLIVWFGFLKSGVHATIAGVLLAFLTPADRTDLDGDGKPDSPVDNWLRRLHPWISFGIMPIFAFFNAGVDLRGSSLEEVFNHSVSQGVGLGLVLGKPIGILLTCYIAVKLGLSQLPGRVRWSQILGVGMIAGIGFTMSLFVSSLAFGGREVELFSKTGILIASTISGVLGFIILSATPRKK